MILLDSLSRPWIQSVAKRIGNIDSVLLEKAIRALFLAEQLNVRGLDFHFKGGTSLLLKLAEPRRFSIDVDIVTSAKREQIITILQSMTDDALFTRWVEDVRRRQHPDLPVEHFKLYYTSDLTSEAMEQYVLLDVIYQKSMPSWNEKTTVSHPWLQTGDEPTTLIVATKEGLLGDKLTAFAPKTTGILYTKDRPLEVVKQLYDIAALFDFVDDLTSVKAVFKQVAELEIAFRKISISPTDVLHDAYHAALTLCTRDEKDPNFLHLQTGIRNIRPHIFQRFTIDEAIIAASKVMYLTQLLNMNNAGPPDRFKNASEVKDWSIELLEMNHFNKLKRSNPEAFYYIVKSIHTT